MKKKRIVSLALFLSLSLLSSCGNSSASQTSSQSSQIDIAVTKLEIATLPKVNYLKYDTLDLSGMVVVQNNYSVGEDLLLSQPVTEYRVTMDGKVVDTGEVLLQSAAKKTLTVSSLSQPDLECTFDIRIQDLRSFSETLSLQGELPTYYHVGDALSLDGLTYVRQVTRTTLDNQRLEETKSLSQSDVQTTIDGKDAKGYVFSKPGRYVLSFLADGVEEKLSLERVLYCLEEESASPEKHGESETLTPDDKEMTVTITTDPTDESYDNYYSPDEVEIAHTIYDYGKRAYDDWVYAPSLPKSGEERAETPILVVPVVLSDGEEVATEENRDLIFKTFFGPGEDLAYESLHSYYWKSSYGQLDITGTVTDYFYAEDFLRIPQVGSMTPELLEKLSSSVRSWVETAYDDDLTEYDSDKDGTIDALWMVFLGRESNPDASYWGLSGTTKNTGDIEHPVVNNYGFIGMDFIDGSYDPGMDKGGDAHVVIHETGHLLGLLDYYSYDGDSYSPLGGLDCMDGGIMDHNPYSKMLLGWSKPYVVYGNSTITIPSSQAKDAFIVVVDDERELIPDAEGILHFDPFDEYLLLDYYTPSNLNSSGYAYAGDEPIQKDGGRLYHVDNRLAYRREGSYRYDLFETPEKAWAYDGDLAKLIVNSRATGETTSGLIGMDSFDEIRWISADGRYISYNRSGKPNEKTLFQAGDSFALSDYADQFNNGMLNSGKAFSSTITIDSIA